MDFKLVQYTCGQQVWDRQCRPCDLEVRAIFCRPSRGGTCHVPRAVDQPKTDTIIVPADRRVEWCLADLDRTSRSDAIPGNPFTHKQHS